jgi:hypothetical protein
MPARYSRKVVLIALLAAASSAPARAENLTAQQTMIGEASMEIAAAQVGPAVVQESSVTEASGRVPPPPAHLGGPREPSALLPAAPRQPSLPHRPPLILGIGY